MKTLSLTVSSFALASLQLQLKIQLKKIKLEKRFSGAQTGIQVSQEIRLPSPNSPVIIQVLF